MGTVKIHDAIDYSSNITVPWVLKNR